MTSVPAAVAEPVHQPPASPGLSRLALVCLSVAVTATVALAAWTVAPALRNGDWRWGAVGLDTIGLASACAAWGRPRLAQPGLLTLAAAFAAYAVAVVAAARGLSPVVFVTSGLASLLAVLMGVLSGAVAGVAGPRPWPRGVVPTVVALPALVVLAHGLLDGWGYSSWLAGVAMLLAAAPGALAVAVLGPLALGDRRAGAAGVRLAHTSAVAASERVTAIVLDGLETVVKGKHVASIDPIEESHLRNLKWFAGALQHASDDAVGRAIARLAGRGNVANVERHPGLGISGSVDRHPVRVGTPTWIGLTAVEGPGVTMAVEVDGRPLGTVTVLDTIRPTAPAAVGLLSADGVEPILLTGAAAATAVDVAASAGVATVVSRSEADVPALVTRHGNGVAVLSPSYADTGVAALVLGPASPQLIVAECAVDRAATAVRVCRSVAQATRQATRLALGWQAVAVLLAAVGVLAPWGAALVALAGSVVTWGSVRRQLRG